MKNKSKRTLGDKDGDRERKKEEKKRESGKQKQAPEGFEPSAFCLLGRRSNQLSYGALTSQAYFYCYELADCNEP